MAKMSILDSKYVKVIYRKLWKILSATNFIFGSSHESPSNHPKIQLFWFARFLYLLKPVSVPCLVSFQLCQYGLDSLKQSCREFLKLQLCQLSHLEIQPGSWDIGQRICCYFLLCNVAMFWYILHVLQFKLKRGGGDGRLASGRDHYMGTPWCPYTGRGPTGQVTSALRPPRRPPLAHPSISPPLLPSSVRTEVEKRATAIAMSSATIVHAHRRTTVYQTASPALPLSHLPRPPISCSYSTSGGATFLDPPRPPCAGPC
jgi:hypothetical protein